MYKMHLLTGSWMATTYERSFIVNALRSTLFDDARGFEAEMLQLNTNVLS